MNQKVMNFFECCEAWVMRAGSHDFFTDVVNGHGQDVGLEVLDKLFGDGHWKDLVIVVG